MKTLKELQEARAALLVEAAKPETTADRLAEIRKQVDGLNLAIAELRKDEADAAHEEELRAARTPNGNGGNPAPVVVHDDTQVDAQKRAAENAEAVEKRAKALKSGNKTTVEHRAVASTSTALGTVASDDITPAFAQVGTLDKLVNTVHLEGTGAESYKKPFAKTIGEGGITAEGADYTDAEPTFDYAPINKVKITAYAEVNEEVEKLPAARYVAEVEGAVIGALRKKTIAQILHGSGKDELVGILNAPANVIDAKQRKTIATIDENTLDEIVFDYGGDEDVEGDAVLILNKLTLKEFAKVKGTDKRRAYDIVVRGNTGTINGIPFVCTSKLPAFATVTAGNPYLIYGKLVGYELAIFADIEVAKSTDYKFKQGVIAFKASQFVGGSPAMFNGFMTVQKAAKA
mgnify:CR=1 FL=1|jgi:HK97 family phage major capsid protein